MPSASVGVTWVRYPLSAQRTTAPTLIAKYFACILDSIPRFAVCFPEDTKHPLAGGVFCWPEVPRTVQERGQLLQSCKYFGGKSSISAYQNKPSQAYMLPLFFGMDFVHTSRYRKTKTTPSDKPVYCSIYLDSSIDKS